MTKNRYWSSWKQPSYYTMFKEIDCLDTFSKNIYISNIIKICPGRSELFHVDRRADRQEATKVVFRMFEKVPISGITPQRAYIRHYTIRCLYQALHHRVPTSCITPQGAYNRHYTTECLYLALYLKVPISGITPQGGYIRHYTTRCKYQALYHKVHVSGITPQGAYIRHYTTRWLYQALHKVQISGIIT